MNTLAILAFAAAAAAAAPPPAAIRAELESLQATLEGAVAPVSRPAGFFAARGGRAYHLKGFGSVVVLAPRALPHPPRATRPEEARARAELAQSLAERIAETGDAAERRRLERALERVRAEEAAPDRRVRIVRLPRPPAPPDRMVEEAEAFRRAAEEAMEQAERDIMVQLRVPEPPPPPPVPDAVVAPVPARPPAPPHPPMPEFDWPVVAPMPPGGFFVFDDGGEGKTPSAVIADVRRAIAKGLRSHRGPLAHLVSGETLAVAVDFLPWMGDRTARATTVVAHVTARDLAAARGGRLTEAELLARMQFEEY